ncbi:PAS domain S-box protein [Rhodoferax koreense]|uniref:PAS domain S-box protein n=1 Tax=Rhodoferax koreensis TaxID=1842727 RepID=A0A1P8JX77_9BURK|nr:EAL domain-containing protein [Rhodoferax koreense]APW38356.1 PAS domain S-box protein [Rhodoferax koreense]
MNAPPRRLQLPPTLRLTWPFIVMVVLQALLAVGSIHTLSAVRAFVAGESEWSKGQKDAIYYLDLYAATGDPDKHGLFREALDVPMGDHLSRLALDQSPRDVAAARSGFRQGHNHPNDIDSLIWLFSNFRSFRMVQEPVKWWAIGDDYMRQLEELSYEIQVRSSAGPVDADTVQQWRRQIRDINVGVTPVATAFSQALGESSRLIVRLLLALNLGAAALLILLSLLHTRKLLAQRRRAENALGAERERAHTTLTAIADGVVTTDEQGRVIYMNPAAEALLAQSAALSRGRPLQDMLVLDTLHAPDGVDESAPGGAPKADANLVRRLLEGGPLLREEQLQRLVRPDQTVVPVKLVGSAIHDQGRLTGAVLVLHDVTREQHYVAQLSWQASHDALTGLVNRREFERRLELVLATPRPVQREGALLYVDLDQFKIVNDTCGHQAGDEMLRRVCRMLQGGLREGDTLARLGGDEFGILLADCPPAPAARVAENLRQAAEELQMAWGSRILRTGLSIGLVPLSPGLDTLQEVLRVADMACYRAKETGRNKVYVYQPEDAALSRQAREMDWLQRLRLALEEDRFCLYAQEIAPLQPGGPAGVHVEVLLRLRDEHGAMVAPGLFIPAAERYGLMPSIDRWVVQHAFATLARQREHPDMPPIATCAINLSGTSLGDERLLEDIRGYFVEHGIAPQTVCFEITETSAIAHLPSAIRLIKALKQLGCRFSLDDFGSGMSSFTYLKHLPVDYLKIDGGFVREMLADPANRAMVEMINHIGHVMGKITIAEFAETMAIVDALRAMGVDYAQGYALARPRPFELPYLDSLKQAATPAG